MRSELVRRVMDNIAKKNIDQMPGEITEDIKDDYEYQKRISLLNYASDKDLDFSSKNITKKKAMDLSSLADKARGRDQGDRPLNQTADVKIKKSKSNKLTLSELSKLSGGKGEKSESYKTSNATKNQNNKTNRGLSLEDLTNNIKKNI